MSSLGHRFLAGVRGRGFVHLYTT